MYIYPAIDLYGGKAVRLYKGDYAQMTVYSDDPVSVARDFAAAGASHIHLVDLEGAKIGKPANLDTIAKIVEATGLFAEVGGGIRDMETVDSYLSIGVSRVILGTAAVKDPVFLQAALDKYGEKIAVGVDLKDGFVAIKGWTETSDLKAEDFFEKMQNLGLKVTLEELQEKYGTQNIGRPHIADYLFENKIVKTRQKAFDIYLAHGRPLYEKKEKCNLDEAIVAICDSGGVPVLAHPLSLYLSWGKLQELLPELHERGIEGLEAWHPGTKLGEAKRLEELAFKNGFFVTAGSDFHGERVRKDRHLGHTTKDIKIDDRFYYEQLLPHLARG